MRFFSVVARHLSFSEAAFELGVSQSAVSQSVATLERNLGVLLVERRGRHIALTAAGSYFATEASRILDEVETLEKDMRTLNWMGQGRLRIAYLNLYRGQELQEAIMRFSTEYPDIRIEVTALCHENIYELLLSDRIDLALSDQRRAFSSDFENFVLAETPVYAEILKSHPFALKSRLSVSELHCLTCILVSPKNYQEVERSYYSHLLGFNGRFLFAETLDAARLMASGSGNFLLVQGRWVPMSGISEDESNRLTTFVPIFKSGQLVKERFCAFCLKRKRSFFVSRFMEILSEVFEGEGSAG